MTLELNPPSLLLGALVASAGLFSLSALPQSQDRASLPFEIGHSVGIPPFVSKAAGKVVDLRGHWMLVNIEPSNTGSVTGGGLVWFNLEQLTAVLPEQPPLGDQEKVQVAEAGILAIYGAVIDFAINNGATYPDSLLDLVTPDENGMRYLNAREIPKDPWGNEYIYQAPMAGREHPLIGTLGADGKPGGEGVNRDFDSATIKGEAK